MNWFLVTLRRALLLLVLGAVGGAVWAWWRERSTPSTPAPAEWPPLRPTPSDATPGPSDATPATSDATPATSDATPGPESDVSTPGTPIETPEPPTPDSDGSWIAPNEDGSCPVGHPVKANANSGIFHVPGGRFYERTKPERCYADPESAEADGYRRAKS